MELVDGISIDEYCRVHRLPTAARLRLFRVVCAAVEHTHQNLVVHRDIKPANILVNSKGVPKLLDFGIAKLLDADEAHLDAARQALRVMTPQYASPEQILGRPVNTLPTFLRSVFCCMSCWRDEIHFGSPGQPRLS